MNLSNTNNIHLYIIDILYCFVEIVGYSCAYPCTNVAPPLRVKTFDGDALNFLQYEDHETGYKQPYLELEGARSHTRDDES